MGWEQRSDVAGVHELPYEHIEDTGLAAAAFYVYGSGGDEDPGVRYTSGDVGNCLVDPEVVSHGTDVIYVGHDIPDMVIANHMHRVPLGGSLPLPGVHAALIVYHAVSATGTAKWSVNAKLSRLPNTGTNGHPGHARDLSGSIVGVRNTAVALTLTALYGLTVTALKLWAPAAPTTVGTYGLECEKNGTDDMLDSAPFDLTTLVAGTTSSVTLTATSANLVLAKDDTILLTATASDHALTGGTFYVLVEATKA